MGANLGDEPVVGYAGLLQPKLFDERLACAQDLARAATRFVQQLAQFAFRDPIRVVVDRLKVDAAIGEQCAQVAARRAGRLFINREGVHRRGSYAPTAPGADYSLSTATKPLLQRFDVAHVLLGRRVHTVFQHRGQALVVTSGCELLIAPSCL